MNKGNTISQWLLHKGAAVFLLVIMSYIVYDIIYGGTLYEVQSLINHGNIIKIYRQSIAALSGTPIFIYVIFFSLRTLFKKGITPSKKTFTHRPCLRVFWGNSIYAGIYSLIPSPLWFNSEEAVPSIH